MGPYGPVYRLYCVYMIYMWFSHCFYMILGGFIHGFGDCSHILKTHFTHIFFTFLENSKDHFSSPPAPKFALLRKIKFTRFLSLPVSF